MSDTDQLVNMANDIGNFFRSQPSRAEAVNGVANHIRSFWTPRMRAKLAAQIEHGAAALDELPREAMRALTSAAGSAPRS